MRSKLLAIAALATILTGCVDVGHDGAHLAARPSATTAVKKSPVPVTHPSHRPAVSRGPALLPGMPRPLVANDIYAADRPGLLSPAVRGDPSLVYVPNSESNTVSVIDPTTFTVIAVYPVGLLPQHVVPSYDLKTLWVNNDNGNTLTPIDPRTHQPGTPVPVEDPYNLYFTPDGKNAVVMAERLHRIDFRDPHTMQLVSSLPVPCSGVNHADFTADGRRFLASCEFSGDLLLVDSAAHRLISTLHLPGNAKPQDVKLSPDGKIFYVADMQTSGLWEIDAASFRMIGFLPTGLGAHGLYVSRDSKYLYVSNRGAGSISLVSFATRSVVLTWHIPGGGSPDMGGVSADGRVLWLSGRYSSVVYAIDVVHWTLLARIQVGAGPHGLCVFPQPGRYSLGHTGIFR